MVASKVSEFLTALRDSQILSSAEVDELARGPMGQGEDTRTLAKQLMQKHGLSAYQVNQLSQGRGKDLVLGPYRVIDRLGEGGMGTVYKARHQTLNRIVAVKVMRKDKLANQSAAKRFYREIQTAGQLVHPNIVVAYDAAEVDGAHYFAMEFVEGTDLSKTVKKSGPLPFDQACDYVRQAALALQYAHERGIVHRDIKPANLLVTQPQTGDKRPVLKILDMGLARLVDSDTETTNLTKLGTILGTPEYLAPEQALNSHTVDIRADVYSLGCTLYFLLVGRPPFKGGHMLEVLMKHRTESRRRCVRSVPTCPTEVVGIVDKMLAKKTDDRYQTPGDVGGGAGAVLPGRCQRLDRASRDPARRRGWRLR